MKVSSFHSPCSCSHFKQMDSFDCSLEMEPRTLRSKQLDVAREEAANVFKKETPEEERKNITEGMKSMEELGRKKSAG
ncbi:unnamed protein product [Victoria cruziana]